MKALSLSLILVSLVVFGTGCGDDDDTSTGIFPTDTALPGTGDGTPTGTPTGDAGTTDDGPDTTTANPDKAIPPDENYIVGTCGDFTPPANALVLADFEEGTTKATCTGVSENCLGIYTISDGTGTMTPDPESGIDAPATPLKGCSDSQYAMCITSDTGFEHWGSGFRLDFNANMEVYGERHPFDLTAYKGIGFWAVLSSGVAGVKVGFPDNNTDSASGECFDATNELATWEEVQSGDRDKSLDCENDWSNTVLLQKQWTYHEISFDNLAINGTWGRQVQDEGHLQDQTFAIKFQRDRSSKPYYYCIDDLALIPND